MFGAKFVLPTNGAETFGADVAAAVEIPIATVGFGSSGEIHL